MDTLFHSTLYWACDYLSILGLKLNHVSKRGLKTMRFKTCHETHFWSAVNALSYNIQRPKPRPNHSAIKTQIQVGFHNFMHVHILTTLSSSLAVLATGGIVYYSLELAVVSTGNASCPLGLDIAKNSVAIIFTILQVAFLLRFSKVSPF